MSRSPRHSASSDDARVTYTVEEAAALLGISRSTAYECASNGQIPVLRLGRRILVPRHALERLLGLQETRPRRAEPGTIRLRVVQAGAGSSTPDLNSPDWARPHRRASTES
jgi:excisionase family DNA binding protein